MGRRLIAACEILDVVEVEGDFPEHEVDIGAGADAGIGEEDHLLPVVVFDEVGEPGEHGVLVVLWQAAEFGHQLVKGEGDELAFDRGDGASLGLQGGCGSPSRRMAGR